MEERRQTSRRRTYKAGMIITHDRFSTVNCLIRNVSEAGAKIEVAFPLALPGRFELLFDGSSFACDLIWRSQHHLGVKFAPPGPPA
jgi:hypothetical protein